MKKFFTIMTTIIMIAIIAIAAVGCNKAPATKNNTMSGKLMGTRHLIDVVSFEEDDATDNKKDDQRWSMDGRATHHFHSYYALLDYLRGC